MDKKLALTIQFLALDKLSNSMQRIIGLGRTGAQQLASLKREARDLDRQLAAVQNRRSGDLIGPIKPERELLAAIERTNRALQRRQMIVRADAQAARMRAQADNLQSKGQQNMIGGVGMLTPFVLATKDAMDFSSGMVDIQQKAGLTNAEMVKMRGNILAAARAAHQMPEDMRAAVDVLAGFGMDPRQAAQLVGPIGRLGTAFKVELADGAAAAFSNINNLKIAMGDTGKAFDIMAAGGNAGAFEIKDMAKWFPQLTAQARALGQQGTAAVADLTAALQIARRGAGDSDQAANNVVNLLAKINAPGTIRAFKKNFGVDLPAALKRAYKEGKTPLEAIAEITKKTLKGDLGRIGFAFEDRQAQDALRILIQDMDDFRRMRADIAKSGGTVDRAFGQRELNDASIAWKIFKSDISATTLVLGAKFLPVASQFLGIVANIASRIGDFAQAHPRLTTNILTAVAAIGVAKIGIGALQFAFGGLLKPMALAWQAFVRIRAAGSVVAAFPNVVRAFTLVRSAAMFMAKGVVRAGLMLLANPVVLAIVAITVAVGAAAYLIWRHWDKIQAAFAAGVAMLGQAWNWIKANVANILPAFGPLGIVASLVIRNWSTIKSAFVAGVGMIGSAWGWIKGAFNTGIAWLAALPGRMLSIGSAIVQGLARGIVNAHVAVWNALKSVVMGGINRIKAFLGIKSPSRLFMGLGGFMTEGLAMGLDKGARRPIGAMQRLASGVAGAMAAGTMGTPALAADSAATVARTAGSVAQSVARGAAPAGAAVARRGETVNIGPINIRQQPGEDGEDLARRVIREIERKYGAARRGDYRDGE